MAEGEATAPSQEEQSTMSLRAVVIGGTGATGKCLVGELLSSKNFSKVTVLGRRNVTVPENYNVNQAEAESEGRLVQVTVDFETLTKDTVGEHFKEKDVLFNTMGTTKAAAGSAAAFVRIDHGYPMKCIEIAKDSGVPHMSLLTSSGAKSNSMLLYLQTKGKLEEDTKKLNFKHLSIFQPGALERGGPISVSVKIAGLFFGRMPVSEVAKGMRLDAEQVAKNNKSSDESKEPQVKVFSHDAIKKLCKEEA